MQSNQKLQYRGETQATAAFTPTTAKIATAEFLAGDNLVTYIFEDTDKKVAVITQPVTADGEFPAIPAVSSLTFTTDRHLLLIENGILKSP